MTKNIFYIILVSHFFILSCSVRINKNKKINSDIMLIKAIPGGSRAHIIAISQSGVLSYNIGSFSNLERIALHLDKNYKERVKILKEEKLYLLSNNLQRISTTYADLKVVKDSWQYYLLIDGKIVFFGYENNQQYFPKEYRDLIIIILKNSHRFYKISGMT